MGARKGDEVEFTAEVGGRVKLPSLDLSHASTMQAGGPAAKRSCNRSSLVFIFGMGQAAATKVA